MSFIDRVMNLLVENCTIMLFSSQVPSIVSGIDFVGMFVITIALSVVFCWLAREYRETRNALCRTVVSLGFFVLCTMISPVFSFGVYFGMMNDVANFDNSLKLLEVVSMVNAAILPAFQLIFPLGFLFYLHSFNLFRWRAIRRAATEWRCFRSCCERENTREAATAPSSHHVPAPSVTFFDVPHSRMTTDVPNEQQALLPDDGGDRGHGSIINS